MIRRILLLLCLGTIAGPIPAEAQYFGRNKVAYEQFDFQVLTTEHFDIHYYPEEAEAARMAARMAERWYARLSRVLGHDLYGRQPLVLYAAHPHFQQTNVIEGEVGEGTGGVTEGLKRRIAMPFAGPLAETDHVLGHEIVHAFQYDISANRDAEGNPTGPAGINLPLWFVEGMAEYLSIGPVDAHTAMWIRDATAREALPTVDRLNDPDFFPYRYGHAFWAFVSGRWGETAIGDMLRAAGPQGDLRRAIESVTGLNEDDFTAAWHEATRREYASIIESTFPADTFGRAVISSTQSGGTLNVAPALSPDGRRLVFLSEKDLFSIDMYVADVDTGEVVRRLVKTAGDPHFDSLQFIGSAGDWAPDGRRFVFAAVSEGQPTLSIVDVNTGDREREQPFEELGEILNPAWSPDGRVVAFSGLSGGLLDLYLWDLESGELTQLTDDPYADLDPEWSPDGRRLAFVTDRFSSDLSLLTFGNYRIGAIDVGSRAITPLAGFPTGRNTNPEFAADGASLYFVGAPDGIANVYRADLAGGETVRLTNIRSGVSGITPLTPSLSVAAAAPRVIFTAYEADSYALYEALGDERPATTPLDRDAAVLPPGDRQPSEVARLLAAPDEGLPPLESYPTEPYDASLSLVSVGQPVIGVGADRFGAYAAGGISMLWSDLLGDHLLGTAVQITSRFDEIGGAVQYLNRKHRWYWGVVGEQTPYVTGSLAQGVGSVDGQFGFIQQTHRLIQTNQGATGLLQYPFNRSQRVEFAAGVRRIGFSQKVETEVFSLATGTRIGRTEERLPSPGALNLSEASTALVYDSSVFGATGPVAGQRYRFEYSQVAGSLTYGGVLGDYRRYLDLGRPFTLAFRGMHYGRYGSGGEDPRLSPLYLGYPGLVRGYDVYSFGANECVANAESSCPAFDRLMGSRLAIGNVELRFPLLGLFSGGRNYYGAFPVEMALFGDAGVAWTADSRASFLGGSRDFVRSVGVALRANALGFAIVELDFVRPLDRPGKGWFWQFNFIPGF